MVATRSSTRSASASATPATAASASSSSTSSSTPNPNPASNSLEIDPVSKARTIAHMNKDHAADLSAILRHRAGLTEAQAAGAEMLDLDLATMTISTPSSSSSSSSSSPDDDDNDHNDDNKKKKNKKSTQGQGQTPKTVIHTVAVDPPMTHWNDRRARLIDMTLEARRALGLPISSDDAEEQQHASSGGGGGGGGAVVVDKWYPPEGADLVPFSIVLLDYVASLLVWTGQLAPGSPLWRLLDETLRFSEVFPGGTAGFAWAVTTACPLFAAAHLLEMFWFDRTRLAPAGVRRASGLWFLWLGGQLVDGFATFQRWDRRVAAAGGGKGKGKGKGDKSL